MFSAISMKENIVEKKRKCWVPASSSFPTMFSKDLFYGVVKGWDCVVKSQTADQSVNAIISFVPIQSIYTSLRIVLHSPIKMLSV